MKRTTTAHPLTLRPRQRSLPLLPGLLPPLASPARSSSLPRPRPAPQPRSRARSFRSPALRPSSRTHQLRRLRPPVDPTELTATDRGRLFRHGGQVWMDERADQDLHSDPLEYRKLNKAQLTRELYNELILIMQHNEPGPRSGRLQSGNDPRQSVQVDPCRQAVGA